MNIKTQRKNTIQGDHISETDEYIRDHKLVELFEDLATAVAYRQPENLEEFLIERLNLHKEQGLRAGIFTENEVRNVYKLFDLKDEKKISKDRCVKAIQTMANSHFQYESHEFTEIPSEVTENEFVKLCQKVLGFAKHDI